MLGEAGLAAHDARPRPRQTEARRRRPVGGHPGSGHGSRRHGPHPDREAVPCRVRMWLAHAAGMALVQPSYGAGDPRWAEHCRFTACQVVRRMMLFGDPATGTLGSLCCVGRGGPSPTPEVLVARWSGARWQAAALGIATGRVRTGCGGSDGVSCAASTDHPSGTLGPNPSSRIRPSESPILACRL